MALSLSRAFGAMGAEVARFDRRKAVVDPELGLMSAEDMQMANFMLPGPNMVRCAPRLTARSRQHARGPARALLSCLRLAPLQLLAAARSGCAAAARRRPRLKFRACVG